MIRSSGQIAASDIREEAGKTAWQSTSYPTAGITKVAPLEMMNPTVDCNHQIGRDFGDGSIAYDKFFGWDTYKRPVISSTEVIQMGIAGGIRLYFEANKGDAIRSGYAVFRTLTKPATWADLSTETPIVMFRHAPEWRPTAPIEERYNRVIFNPSGTGLGHTDLTVLGEDSLGQFPFLYVQDWGHVAGYTIPPEHLIDFASYAEGTRVGYSLYIPALAGNTYYITIVPFDGRQFHSLGEALNDSYNVGSDSTDGALNPASLSSYQRGNLVNTNVHSYGAADNGDGGINIYSDIGSLIVADKTHNSVIISAQHPYETYDQLTDGGSHKWWYWLSNMADQLPPEPISEANGWVKTGGLPFGIQNLASSKQYYLYVTRAGASGEGDTTYTTFDFTTDPAPPVDPAITIGATSSDGVFWNVSWDDNDTSYSVQGFQTKVIHNDGTEENWMAAGSADNQNPSFTGTGLTATATTNPFPNSGDTVKLRAVLNDNIYISLATQTVT